MIHKILKDLVIMINKKEKNRADAGGQGKP